MRHPNWMQSPPNYQDFSLGSLTAQSEAHTRLITELRADHKALKLEVDKMRAWGERMGMLVVMYLCGTGLLVSAGTTGPLLGTMVRSALGLR